METFFAAGVVVFAHDFSLLSEGLLPWGRRQDLSSGAAHDWQINHSSGSHRRVRTISLDEPHVDKMKAQKSRTQPMAHQQILGMLQALPVAT